MKDYYTIGEISRLYGIGADSLRYYEKMGAIRPKRGENGYRYYSMKDIYRLNIIRDLLYLGFSMEQISVYLNRQDLSSSLALFEQAVLEIQRKKAELEEMEKVIKKRLERIRGFGGRLWQDGAQACEGPRIVEYPQRDCLRLDRKARKDEELDFLLTSLYRSCQEGILDFGDHIRGGIMHMEDIEKEIWGLYHGVFLLLEKEDHPGEKETLPAGRYLSLVYRGGYEQLPLRLKELTAFAREKGLATGREVLELYRIDNHDTSQPREFVTELAVLLC